MNDFCGVTSLVGIPFWNCVVLALKSVEESALSPWSDDLHGGLDRVEGEFEADLICA